MSDGAIAVWRFVLGALFGVLVAVNIHAVTTDHWWRTELAARGVAHYYIDANGKRQWDWKKPVEVQP